MKYTLKVAEELVPVLAAYNSRPQPPAGTKMEAIFRADLTAAASQTKVHTDDKLTVEDKFFTNSEGIAIQLRVYTPKGLGTSLPCLYWIHGGGTMSGLPEQDDQPMYALALRVSCVIVSVNYRLAPENPYPAAINDCYEGLENVYNNAALFNINKDKIAVGGGSAGGMLSTSCAILARDRKGPKIIHQSLTYPMLDHRGITNSSHEITSIGVWDRDMNLYGWQCYLSSVKDNIPNIAVPMLVEDLSGLPPAFLAVGTMDVLRDEVIEYAQKLAAAGVITGLHIYPGMVHVFDALVPGSPSVKDYQSARASALINAFED